MGVTQKKSKVLSDVSFEEEPNVQKSIVLVDDDLVFSQLFASVGRAFGVHVQAYKSLAEMTSFGHLKEYDIAILDYHLENFKGTEIAEYVDVFFPDLPVFLISADDDLSQHDCKWPESILRFFKKSQGVPKIIQESMRELEKIRFYDMLRKRGSSVSDPNLKS